MGRTPNLLLFLSHIIATTVYLQAHASTRRGGGGATKGFNTPLVGGWIRVHSFPATGSAALDHKQRG